MQPPPRPTGWWAPFALVVAAGIVAAGALVPAVREGGGAAHFLAAGGALAVWILVLFVRARGRLGIELVPAQKSHYIQTLVQLTIYTAWAWYWPGVVAQAPLILVQFAFVYAFEGALVWSRGRAWRAGFGPLPIVLSTNIFLWFVPEWFVLQFLMLAAAIASKEFLQWERDGKRVHIFNPSAFGLGLASLVLLATGTTDLTSGVEIATTIARPPFIYLLIFGLGLVVQYFFATTLVTLAAAATLYALNQVYTHVTGVYHFLDVNISAAVFLGFHLLVTDPKTSPVTRAGKVMFGASYGLAIWIAYSLLGDAGMPQFYDKLLPIPLLNLGVRAFDAAARSGVFSGLESAWQRVSGAATNRAAMIGWAALFGTMVATGFVGGRHEANSVEFWMRAYDERKPGARDKALAKLELRALAGSGRAAAALGTLHAEGRLVKQDRARAAAFFALSSEAGELQGSLLLVEHYFTHGIARSPADVERALAHLERAADDDATGRVHALLGFAHESARGRPADAGLARDWYVRGVERGDVGAAQGLVRYAASGGSVPEGALRRAAQILSTAAASGDARSAGHLALAHEFGLGVPKDARLAHQWRATSLAGAPTRSGTTATLD